MTKKPEGWKDLTMAGIIEEAGNSNKFETGSWRSDRPIWDESKCTSCLMCWIYCPDTSIMLKDGKMVGIDLDHCKGCGICAAECPVKGKAIHMKPESECDLG